MLGAMMGAMFQYLEESGPMIRAMKLNAIESPPWAPGGIVEIYIIESSKPFDHFIVGDV